MKQTTLILICALSAPLAGCSDSYWDERERDERIRWIQKERAFLIEHKNNLEAQIRATTSDFNSNDPEVVRLRNELYRTLDAIDYNKQQEADVLRESFDASVP